MATMAKGVYLISCYLNAIQYHGDGTLKRIIMKNTGLMRRVQLGLLSISLSLIIIPLTAISLASTTYLSSAAEKSVKADEPSKTASSPKAAKKKVETMDFDTAAEKGWKELFDGHTLTGWKPSDFAGKGEVTVEKGQIVMSMGNDMTGITFTNDFPKVNYEISIKAMKVDGNDFFCGLTFPVKKEFCSLICGGWGGGVVGISSVNGMDASSNETTTFTSFEQKKLYHIFLRVTDNNIQAWIDKKQVVNLEILDQPLSTRIEVEECKPLGVANWQTSSAIKEFKMREINPEPKKKSKKQD